MRFKNLPVVTKMSTAFWNVTLSGLIETYQHFEILPSPLGYTLKMEVAGCSEAYVYLSSRLHGNTTQSHRENSKFHRIFSLDSQMVGQELNLGHSNGARVLTADSCFQS
jgi:hypothetical protein